MFCSCISNLSMRLILFFVCYILKLKIVMCLLSIIENDKNKELMFGSIILKNIFY